MEEESGGNKDRSLDAGRHLVEVNEVSMRCEASREDRYAIGCSDFVYFLSLLKEKKKAQSFNCIEVGIKIQIYRVPP